MDKDINVREEFLGFFECTSGVTGEALAEDILGKLEKDWQLNIQMFCGQGYDGAGAMAGKRKGVVARIMTKYPKALYTHCASHVLNLCIVEATNIVYVRNMMDVASCVARFFNNSPKRQLLLENSLMSIIKWLQIHLKELN